MKGLRSNICPPCAGRLLLALAFALSSFTGCGDACGDASNECLDASTVRACRGSVDAFGQSRHWVTTACPAQNPDCVVTTVAATAAPYDRDNPAICATSASRSPDCAQDPSRRFCRGADIFVCQDGYLTWLSSCPAGCDPAKASCL